VRAAILKPKVGAINVARAFGRRGPMPIMSVILEAGEQSIKREVLESLAPTRDTYLVSVLDQREAEYALLRAQQQEPVVQAIDPAT
jgi:peptide subunit release factor 1 (eRF1)